jgi:hypothetical protein
MKAGDTFLIDEPGTSLDSHLWIIISDPEIDPDHLVIVNLTTYREDKDQACVLNREDHAFIQHKTCVEYKRAKIVSAEKLQMFLDSGRISSREACSDSLLKKIRNGVADSRMYWDAVNILVAQELVEI